MYYLPLLLVLKCPLNGLAGPHLGMPTVGYSLALTKYQTKQMLGKKDNMYFDRQDEAKNVSPENSWITVVDLLHRGEKNSYSNAILLLKYDSIIKQLDLNTNTVEYFHWFREINSRRNN